MRVDDRRVAGVGATSGAKPRCGWTSRYGVDVEIRTTTRQNNSTRQPAPAGASFPSVSPAPATPTFGGQASPRPPAQLFFTWGVVEDVEAFAAFELVAVHQQDADCRADEFAGRVQPQLAA
jgi:hypothetical protein